MLMKPVGPQAHTPHRWKDVLQC